MHAGTKVIIGLSGGVDSAVAALILKNQGYDVHAVFMQNWEADQDDPYCTIEQDLFDAKAVAEKLAIPFTAINFSKEYWQNVFQYFLDEYAAGHTPNPDVLCNKEIKFKAFLNYALDAGAAYIATGHYARKDRTNNKYRLLRGLDKGKDQSYFLHTITQKQLAHSLFPIGDLQKSEVRALANEAGFINAEKKDSTGICFIGERNFKEFLGEYLLAQPGEIVTTTNEVIGKHDGLMFYTLGQRKGLGIGGRKNAPEKPWYVVTKDLENNRLVADQNHNHPLLLSKNLTCSNPHWISEENPRLPIECTAKIRYQHRDQKCNIVSQLSGLLDVVFEQEQWAITAGQSVVFYQDEECLGGGTIK